MPSSATPSSVESECDVVDETMLFDAIRMSVCSYWMYRMDVMEQFSSAFRWKLYRCMSALPRVTRMYFDYQIGSSSRKPLLHEYIAYMENAGRPLEDPLNNPLSMLGNAMRDADLKVLHGHISPRQMLLGQIQLFLDTKDASHIDFSHSLFLPEFLNPKFFQCLSEAEHIVLVGNLNMYFDCLTALRRSGINVLSGSTIRRNELLPPQALIKHILGDARGIYTHRVKAMAWERLCDQQDRLSKIGPCDMFNTSIVCRNYDDLNAEMAKRGVSHDDVNGWVKAADGVFESFELDCTLHNMDATDFIIQLMMGGDGQRLVRGLMDFQDSSTQDTLFMTVSEAMTSFRV